MRTSSACVILMAMVGWVAAPGVMAAPDDGAKSDAPPREAAPADNGGEGGLLAGPKVADEPGTPDNPAFAGEDRYRQPVEIPPRRWFHELEKLELRENQREKVNAIVHEFQDASRRFQQENREAMRELQAEIKQARESARPDPSLRERYRELQRKAPQAKEYQDRIWNLLDEAQQTELKARLEAVRGEIAARRADQRSSRIDAARRKPAGDDPMSMEETGPAGGDMMSGRVGARGERSRWGAALDARSQKRLAFLLSRRSKDAPARPGFDRLRERRGAAGNAPDEKPITPREDTPDSRME